MSVARIVAPVVFLVMLVAIGTGFATASFTEDGKALLDLTWGVVTLVDIYAAFLFAWLWIAWREADVVRAGLWLVAVITLGSLAIAAYVGLAAFRADSTEQLLLGDRQGS